MSLEDRVKKQEKKKTLLAVSVMVVLLLTFIWNLLVLPSIVEKTMNSKNDAYTCNNFCSNVEGAKQFELEYHDDKGIVYCYCRDDEGKILARPTYHIV